MFYKVVLKLKKSYYRPSLKLSSLALFEHLAKKWDLCDIWRMRNPDCKRFTYRQKNPFLQRRLDDYFLISDELQESINKVDVLPSLRSDHSPIYMKYVDSQRYARKFVLEI